ncbi:MAG: GNAT family N-acetyltransferase [Anaerolineae bacterium]|nr:GNAT family N-acetyltransferase [Anaerolineae bacterium]
MIPGVTKGLWHLYRRSKVRLNALLYRVIEECSLILSGAREVPFPLLQRALQRMARCVGDVCWLLRDFPRLPAYRLAGSQWTIVLVGGEHSLIEVQRLFFADQEVTLQELGRVSLWKLTAQIRCWLSEETDLVICELSRIYPRRFPFPIVFTIPTWVQQVTEIPNPPERLLVGRHQDGTRFRINRARRSGFDCRFSRAKEDLKHFYYRMYLPFVTGRHGKSAIVTPYSQQFQRFRKGGVLLITRNGEPVAGSLCYVAGQICYGSEYGVIDNDPDLIQQGIGTLVIWYTLLWAHKQRCLFLSLGGTRSWCSNGSFEYKLKWQPTVTRLNEIYSTWTFLAQRLSPALEEHLNQIGFICEIRERFYRVLVKSNSQKMDKEFLDRELARARHQGLAGLAIIAPSSPVILYQAGERALETKGKRLWREFGSPNLSEDSQTLRL